MIVAIEGIDGAGKSVQASLLAERAGAAGYSVFCRDYPRYENFFGKKIGELLVNRTDGALAVDPYSMSLWYAIDRHIDHLSVVSPELSRNDLIIFNRYTLSSQIFQSIRSEETEISDWIDNLEHRQLGLPRPDLYIILDGDPTVSAARNAKKQGRDYLSSGADIYESDLPLQERATRAYRSTAKSRQDAVLISQYVEAADGNRLLSPHEISSSVCSVINDRLGLAI